MKDILEKVRKAVDSETTEENVREIMESRKERLHTLVNKFGFEIVAIAGGFKESTLRQYLRAKWPFAIGEVRLHRAERILNSISSEDD